MTPLAPLVTTFFRQILVAEKGVSKNTIDCYSYAFKFLCRYVSGRLGKSPSQLALEDLDAPMVRDFLEHLELDCGNTARTRNLRLTAIRSFMKHVEYEVPSALEQVRRIFAISGKRTEERLINHLTQEEMKAILDAPDPSDRSGIRDQAMLYLGFAAGLRVSELVGLRLEDIELDGPYPSILVRGKARKQRRLPLWKEATRDIRKVALWLGHSSLRSTEIYLRADPTEKLKTIEAALPPNLRRGVFRVEDRLIAWLAGKKISGVDPWPEPVHDRPAPPNSS